VARSDLLEAPVHTKWIHRVARGGTTTSDWVVLQESFLEGGNTSVRGNIVAVLPPGPKPSRKLNAAIKLKPTYKIVLASIARAIRF
jgi:hypothetical protein